MGISPISGIRPMPVAKTPPADSDLSRVFDIENTSKPGDDTYSGNGKRSAGGQDDDGDAPEDSRAVESVEKPAEDDNGAQISIFA